MKNDSNESKSDGKRKQKIKINKNNQICKNLVQKIYIVGVRGYEICNINNANMCFFQKVRERFDHIFQLHKWSSCKNFKRFAEQCCKELCHGSVSFLCVRIFILMNRFILIMKRGFKAYPDTILTHWMKLWRNYVNNDLKGEEILHLLYLERRFPHFLCLQRLLWKIDELA